MPVPLLIDPSDRPDEQWADPAKGRFRWRTLLSSHLTDSDTFTAGIMSLAPGDQWALHRHSEPEIYFGIAGEENVEVDGKLYLLKPETLLFIPGNAFHGVPKTNGALRFFYVFAKDSFDTIAYVFKES